MFDEMKDVVSIRFETMHENDVNKFVGVEHDKWRMVSNGPMDSEENIFHKIRDYGSYFRIVKKKTRLSDMHYTRNMHMSRLRGESMFITNIEDDIDSVSSIGFSPEDIEQKKCRSLSPWEMSLNPDHQYYIIFTINFCQFYEKMFRAFEPKNITPHISQMRTLVPYKNKLDKNSVDVYYSKKADLIKSQI